MCCRTMESYLHGATAHRNGELVDWSEEEIDAHLAKQVVLSLEFSNQHRKQKAWRKG